jgi:hypothetical protein
VSAAVEVELPASEPSNGLSCANSGILLAPQASNVTDRPLAMRLHIPISSLAAPRGGTSAADLASADAQLRPVLPGKGGSMHRCCLVVIRHVCRITRTLAFQIQQCLVNGSSADT